MSTEDGSSVEKGEREERRMRAVHGGCEAGHETKVDDAETVDENGSTGLREEKETEDEVDGVWKERHVMSRKNDNERR